MIEYYLKTRRSLVYFLKETTKIEGNGCILILVERFIAFETEQLLMDNVATDHDFSIIYTMHFSLYLSQIFYF